jgi:chitodextrinase
MTKTHREDRKSYVHKSTYQEFVKDTTYIEDVDMPDSKNQQTLKRKSGVHESTCQKGMMNKTY